MKAFWVVYMVLGINGELLTNSHQTFEFGGSLNHYLTPHLICFTRIDCLWSGRKVPRFIGNYTAVGKSGQMRVAFRLKLLKFVKPDFR